MLSFLLLALKNIILQLCRHNQFYSSLLYSNNIYQYVKFSFNFKVPLQLVNESCQNYLMNVFVPDFVRLVQIEYPGLSYTRSMKCNKRISHSN